MIFSVGRSNAENEARIKAKLAPQPWVLRFAWHPVHVGDNVWIWGEYYETQDIYSYSWQLGLMCNQYNVRSTLRKVGHGFAQGKIDDHN